MLQKHAHPQPGHLGQHDNQQMSEQSNEVRHGPAAAHPVLGRLVQNEVAAPALGLLSLKSEGLLPHGARFARAQILRICAARIQQVRGHRTAYG